MRSLKFATCLLPLMATACTLAPAYQRPALPVTGAWQASASPPASTADLQLHWKALFVDVRLQKTVQLALDNNRDLRVAALNITRARAQYGIAGAGLLPALDSGVSGSKSHVDTPTTAAVARDKETYSADLGLSWELDIFGKIRSLKSAALESFLAERDNRNAVAIALITQTTDAWLTLAADRDYLRLSQETFKIRQHAFTISEGQARIGTINDMDLSSAKVLLEQARGDVAAAKTKVEQDISALTLLAGTAITPDLLPQGLDDAVVASNLPVGLPSDVLLNRPDILSAEHSLKAANADIGAARAAFFPSISLTGSTGSASVALGDLFKSGNGTYGYGLGVSVPIFNGGANLNSLRSTKAGRDIAIAQYEHAIQTAFNEVNQALAVHARIDERLSAQQSATDAAERAYALSKARYDAGSDSYLTLIDAQRTLYTSQQALISLKALKAINLAGLYAALADSKSLD